MEIDPQLTDRIGAAIYVDSITCIVHNHLLTTCTYYLTVIDQRKENRKMIKQKIKKLARTLKVKQVIENLGKVKTT